MDKEGDEAGEGGLYVYVSRGWVVGIGDRFSYSQELIYLSLSNRLCANVLD